MYCSRGRSGIRLITNVPLFRDVTSRHESIVVQVNDSTEFELFDKIYLFRELIRESIFSTRSKTQKISLAWRTDQSIHIHILYSTMQERYESTDVSQPRQIIYVTSSQQTSWFPLQILVSEVCWWRCENGEANTSTCCCRFINNIPCRLCPVVVFDNTTDRSANHNKIWYSWSIIFFCSPKSNHNSNDAVQQEKKKILFCSVFSQSWWLFFTPAVLQAGKTRWRQKKTKRRDSLFHTILSPRSSRSQCYHFPTESIVVTEKETPKLFSTALPSSKITRLWVQW